MRRIAAGLPVLFWALWTCADIAGAGVSFSERRRVRVDGPGLRVPQAPTPVVYDWDGDGVPDFLLSGSAAPIFLYKGEASGGFGYPEPVEVNKRVVYLGRSAFGVADLTGNGTPDLIAGAGRGLALYLNTGTPGQPRFGDGLVEGYGEFRQGSGIQVDGEEVQFQAAVSGLAVADWDSDGLADLIVGEAVGRVWWLRNAGSAREPRFAAPELIEAAGQSVLGDAHFACPAVADLNGDGLPDLLVSAYYKGIQAYINHGAPGKPLLKPLPKPLFDKGPAMLHLSDLNGDGKPDLLVGMYWSEALFSATNTTAIAAGETGGVVEIAFGKLKRVEGRDFSYRRFLTASFADLNGDGVEDLLAGSHNRALHFYLRGDPRSFRFPDPVIGVGSPTIQASQMGLRGIKEPLRSLQPFPCDWNGDGAVDLVFGGQGGAIILLQNFGTRRRADFDMRRPKGFNATLLHNDERGWPVPLLADLDNDGRPDLVVGNAAGEIYWMRNKGFTHWVRFEEPSPLLCDGSALRVKGTAAPFMFDWNGDGRPDLLVGCGDGEIRVFTGTENPLEFADAGAIEADGSPIKTRTRARPWVMDWDGDGVPDLLVIAEDDYLVCYQGARP